MMASLDAIRRSICKRGDLIRRFLKEDCGQDIIEYALITGFVGIVGMLTMEAIEGQIYDTYTTWLDPGSGTPSLWEPDDPIVP